MKKSISFATSLIVAVLFFSPIFSQTTTSWDQKTIANITSHIQKNGVFDGKDTYLIILPKEGEISIQGHGANQIVNINQGDLDVTIWLQETKLYKANMNKGKFFGRLNEEDVKKIVQKVEIFLNNFAKEKPLPPTPLFKGTDPLSKSFFTFVSKMKKYPNTEYNDGTYLYTQEEGDIFIIYTPWYVDDLREERIYFASGEEEYHISFDSNRPIKQGIYSTSPKSEDLPVTEQLLTKVFASIK